MAQEPTVTDRLDKLEAQMAEVLLSMHRALEVAGLAQRPRRHLTLVRDDTVKGA